MEPVCLRCGRKIPKKRLANALKVGREPLYDTDRCQAAAKQERYRHRSPTSLQDRIHLRNLVAHGMIVEKLLRDPSLLTIAESNLEKWIAVRGELPALLDWQELFREGDLNAIMRALLRVDEEGMRLRSSSPFAGILSDPERNLVFEGTRK